MTHTAPPVNRRAIQAAYRLAHGALGRLVVELRRNGLDDAADACTLALGEIGRAITTAVNREAA